MAIKRMGQMKTIGESESRVYGSCFYYSVNILKFETTSKFKFIKKRARTSCSKLLLSTSSMKTIYSLKVIRKLEVILIKSLQEYNLVVKPIQCTLKLLF